MKLKKCMGLLLCASFVFTACGKNDDTAAELTDEEKERNAVIDWFENDIYDEDEFTDVLDYRYYARTIGLEADGLLSPDMWEIYYSESININREIDGTAVYLIRLNPDKLLEVWAENNEMTADEICSELGTDRDELYYNFGYTANSVDYSKNHKDSRVSYPEVEENIFGADNGENRQVVFGTHFLKVHTGGRYNVTYESTNEALEIKQRDLLKSVTKPKTYNYSEYSVDEYTPAFYVNDVGIKRIQLLTIPNGWVNAVDKDITMMFNMSPFSYGCTDEDRIDIFVDKSEENAVTETSEVSDVPPEHLETVSENITDEALDGVDRTDRVTVKDIERAKEKLRVQLEQLLNSPKDNALTFEQLGFDYLVVDEAHNYKNCLVVSKMSNVAGVQTTSAKKSEDMLMKTQYLNEKYGYGNVLWATGTPVAGLQQLNTKFNFNSVVVGNSHDLDHRRGNLAFFFKR